MANNCIDKDALYDIGYLRISGQEICDAVNSYYQVISTVENISISLHRAIEEGDPFNTGLVIGQIMSQLKRINEKRLPS